MLLTIAPPGGMPEALPAVLALSGFGALLVALMPDWMLQLKRRAGRLPQPSGPGQRRERHAGRGEGEHGAHPVDAEQPGEQPRRRA